MNTQKFRPTKDKNKNAASIEETFKPSNSNPTKMGNPPIEDLTRWEEDGGTVLYDCSAESDWDANGDSILNH